jgi:acyl-CoA synthetase (AMP-forming)/AMP-acid ligase II
MNISELLARNARKYPHKDVIIEGNVSLSYADVDRTVNRLASSLKRLGIRQGDKVVIYMPNTKEFVYAYFAVLRLGALVVPTNARLVAEEMRYIIQHSEAKAVIAHDWIYKELQALVGELDVVWIKTGEEQDGWLSLAALIAEGASDEIRCSLNEDDEAAILYTSGTTGRPKGVLFTYRNILTVATMMALETKMSKESRLLHMMPLSHSAPLHLFFIGGMYVGATHVLSPSFSPEALLTLVEQQQITHFFGAPVAYLLTAKHPHIHHHDLSSVQYWTYGGAPLSKNEVLFIKEQFRTNRLMCLYGLTESGPNGIYLAPHEHETKAGSVGKDAALHCEVRIVDENGNDVPPGEIGEVILSGEGTMKGYYKNKEKTAETLKNGWVYTGDLARRDEDGYIWIIDRKKDLIISGGVNVYPKEVEDVLKTHPYIVDVAVVGVPHPEWGETVKAFIVPSQPIEDLAEECKRFLKGKIAEYKIPRLYEEISELPRNATGKVLKQVLKTRGIANENIARS